MAAATRQFRGNQGQVLSRTLSPQSELTYTPEDAVPRHVRKVGNSTCQLSWVESERLVPRPPKNPRTSEAQLPAELKATVRANVAAAYFDVLTAQERLALARDCAALAKSSTDTVAKRVAA